MLGNEPFERCVRSLFVPSQVGNAGEGPERVVAPSRGGELRQESLKGPRRGLQITPIMKVHCTDQVGRVIEPLAAKRPKQ